MKEFSLNKFDRSYQLVQLMVTCTVFRLDKEHRLQVLIVQESASKKGDSRLWTVPGGEVNKKDWGFEPKDKNEGKPGVLERALKREIKEKCGISVDLFFLFKNRDVAVLQTGNTPAKVVVKFWAPYRGPALSNPQNGTETFQWIVPHELESYSFVEGVKEDVTLGFVEARRHIGYFIDHPFEGLGPAL